MLKYLFCPDVPKFPSDASLLIARINRSRPSFSCSKSSDLNDALDTIGKIVKFNGRSVHQFPWRRLPLRCELAPYFDEVQRAKFHWFCGCTHLIDPALAKLEFADFFGYSEESRRGEQSR